MSNVPTNLIPTRITGLPEYMGTSTLGYIPYILDGRTYKVQFGQIAAVGAVPSTRVIAAGTGLAGGGDLSENRVISIANGGVGFDQLSATGVVAGSYGSGSEVPVVTVDIKGRITDISTTPLVITGYVPDSRLISTGAGLLGGGSLASNRTLSVDFSSATPQALGSATAGVSNAAARGDHVHPAVNLSDTNQTQGALPLGRGGTGDALSPVAGAVVYSTGTKFALADPGDPGQVLTSNGSGEPYWRTITGTGTVTNVSVLTANGFSGTVAFADTTPQITLSTTVNGMIKGDGLSMLAAAPGVDYVAPSAYISSGLTMATSRLLGRTDAGTGEAQEITVGTGLSLSAGSLVNSAPDQTVTLTGGTAISISGSYPSFTITNTAPDQVVSLTGAGTTTVTGTYPNFTITSNDAYTGTVTSVAASGGSTGLTFSGSPITTSGTLTLGGTLAVASGGTGATTAAGARTNLGAAASGANSDITSLSGITGAIGTPTYIQFDSGAGTTLAAGRLWYDQITGSLNMGMGGGNITQQIGEELFVYGKASAAITEGQVVVKTGAVGASGVITFAPAPLNTTDTQAIIGVATENIPLNGFGRITSFGVVHGINTTGAAYGETWADGDTLYYNPNYVGGLTKVKPSAPNQKTEVGIVINAGSGGSGSIQVEIIHGTVLGGTDSNVQLTSPANNELLQYSSSLGYWRNVSNTSVSVGSATTATNLAGGAGGSIPYQSIAGTTTFLASGTGVLTASGGNPSYTMSPSLTQVTVAADPTTNLQVATKQYVDTLVASGITYHTPVKYEVPDTTGNLNATYNNGTAGVGATLTNAGTLAAFTPDGTVAQVGDRILVYNQTNAYENGVYTVTTVGSGSVAWVLTRATDADSYALKDPNGLGEGDAFFITSGATGAGETYVCNTTGTITFGTTPITFAQVSATQVYSAGTGLTLTGTTFSLTSPVATSLGGTGLTSFTSGGAVYATSTSALTTGTLPLTAGGTGATTAVGARTSLGGTTVGSNFFTLTNPSAITFPQINADNTVSALSAAAFRAAIGAGTGGGSVTSVDVSGGTTGLTTSGGPITSSGTITLAGTLNVANGGTGATSLSSGYLIKGNGASAVSASVVYDDGTNVGIGTSSPNAKLTVNGDITSNKFAFYNEGAGANYNYTGYVRFANGGTEAMRIDASGNVLIGTTTAVDNNFPLELNAGASGLRGMGVNNNGGYGVYLTYDNTGRYSTNGSAIRNIANSPLYFETNNTLRATLDASGNLGLGVTPSAWSATARAFEFGPYGALYQNASGYPELAFNTYVNTSNNYTYRNTDVASRYLQYNGQHQWYTAPSGTAGAAISFTQAMTLDASGRLGVGVTPATNRLVMARGQYLAWQNTGTLAEASGITADTSDNMIFFNNGSERMRITSQGDVAIGTTSGGTGLFVVPRANVPYTIFNTASAGYGYSAYQYAGSAYGYIGQASSMIGGASNTDFAVRAENNLYFSLAGSDTMRLTSSGLTISGAVTNLYIQPSTTTNNALVRAINAGGTAYIGLDNSSGGLGGAYSLNMWHSGAYPIVFATSNTERMRIDASGNVGIGTSSPGFLLHGVQNGNAEFRVSATNVGTNSAGLTVENQGNRNWNLWANRSTDNFIIGANTRANDFLVINGSSGNVGIGTSSPGYKLDVNGTGSFVGSSGVGAIRVAGAGGSWFWIDNPTGTTMRFSSGATAGTNPMVLDSSGNVGIGTSSYVGKLSVSLGSATSAGAPGAWDSTYALFGGTTANAPAVAIGFNSASGGIISSLAAGVAWRPMNYHGDSHLFYLYGSEAMRLNAAGNLGLGTSSPTTKLKVYGASGNNPTIINVQHDVAGNTFDYASVSATSNLGSVGITAWASGSARGGTGWVQTVGSIPLVVGVNDTEVARFNTSGNLLVGTTTSYSRLTVSNGASTRSGITISDTNTASLMLFAGASAGAVISTDSVYQDLIFKRGSSVGTENGTETMRITGSGNLLLGTSTTTNTGQVISTAGANFSSTATKNSNMTGLTVSATTNASTMTGVWFATGNVTHWSGIAGARTNHTVDWSTHLAFYTHPADFTNIDSTYERMRIDGAGNVGIGTTSPASLLHVKRGSNATEVYPSGTWASRIINATDSSGENGLLVGNRWAGTASTAFEVGSIFGGGTGSWFSYYRIDGVGQSIWSNQGTERMRLDTSGNLGLGTSSPGVRLDVAGSIRVTNNSSVQFRNTAGTGVAYFTLQNDDNFVVYNAAGTPIQSFTQAANPLAVYGGNANNRMVVDSGSNITYWLVNGSERMRINSSGEVLMGTSTGGRAVCMYASDMWLRLSNASRQWLIGPSNGSNFNIWDETGGANRFYIDSTGTAVFTGLVVGRTSSSTDVNAANDTGSFSVRGDTTKVAAISFHRTSAYAINMGLGLDAVFRIGGWSASSNCFQMDGSGNLTMLGNVTAYSDARMKKDVETIDSALDLVSKMRGVRYTRTDTNKRGVGVIAQEMLEVMPEVVQQGVGSDDTLSVAYGNLVGVLIEAIKELRAEVAELKGS